MEWDQVVAVLQNYCDEDMTIRVREIAQWAFYRLEWEAEENVQVVCDDLEHPEGSSLSKRDLMAAKGRLAEPSRAVETMRQELARLFSEQGACVGEDQDH